MMDFYAQISATQATVRPVATPSATPSISTLATLTRLTREQMKALAGDNVWNTWGV